ncbi:MAG: (2E,6E)-farnesyl diphosphate synthase [Proteobacteria bacterium]|nr:(2E,6E)-farnesyl diphosphate synthase [Pseudomonadota bacterium]MBT6192560.1 (2E,6E)-farnesyl diphosphate synthase [Pseudomonadota bacterium]MBT6465625.1 (2E,6E)-farnesyl diphosphate synthase [Pseudomonadota bacterium]MBT6674701.1 (2E,6E)-farnesyl diphosphate synthase [Pseudomonadota bacterium]MBT7246435.1 (2E,6E)-farnesyl diphosphate synthase [Pseudomonadota bacterium]
MTIDNILKPLQSRINTTLEKFLPLENQEPHFLSNAMRYSVLAPGKRLRPVLTYLTGQVFGAPLSVLDVPAAAVELIHAYSLIHDDLPAMDDDDLRRGRPTCHKQYDEATAILAGDALQALAVEVLLKNQDISLSDKSLLDMLRVLMSASGSDGMVAGQALDLAAVGRVLTIEELENIHRHKTGDLISASVILGYLASGQKDSIVLEHLKRYAMCIGLAFQVQDDILDVEGTTEEMGKPQGSDAGLSKPTYPNILGIPKAKETALNLRNEAINALDFLPEDTSILAQIADFIIYRKK